VLVLVEPRRRRLRWVPRDLWVADIRRRVNKAFALDGHAGLLRALREHRLDVEHSICVRRDACERALAEIEVTVPVAETLRYRYPRTPTSPIEDGEREVRFDPPEERLAGVRLHEWIGARLAVGRGSSDLERIRRQQTFVAALLRDGVRPAAWMVSDPGVAISAPAALRDLSAVDAGWRLETLDRLQPATIDGMDVLVRRRPPARAAGRLAARIRSRLRSRPRR
jgi:hypothetical protein